MASFEYKGNTYFYFKGKWMDAQSRAVRPEMAEELEKLYSEEAIKAREQRQHQKKKASPRNIPAKAELTEEQKRALAVLESGKNVFLSGEAGTGKSFVLNEFIRRNKKRNLVVCAPTGIAAINVGGATLHRVFQAPIGVIRPGEFSTKPDEAVMKADIIIIDEISMCRFDLFEYVVRTIRQAEALRQKKENIDAMSGGRTPRLFAPKQLIVIGDFYQLAPVVTAADREVLEQYWEIRNLTEGYAFQSDLWYELDFQNVLLTEVMRQRGNDAYIRSLNRIRVGDYRGIGWFNENVRQDAIPNGIYLCATNRVANDINAKESEALAGEPVTYTAEIKGNVQASDKMTDDELTLKVGMQVMTLVNDAQEGFQNGSIGKVTALKKEAVEVRLNSGKIVKVKPYDWEICGYEVQEEKLEKIVLGNFKQIPIKIAYAITIHKSQGQTYSCVNISPDCFADGQLYVALSRARSVENMSLDHAIRPRALRTSRSVKLFYDGLKE